MLLQALSPSNIKRASGNEIFLPLNICMLSLKGRGKSTPPTSKLVPKIEPDSKGNQNMPYNLATLLKEAITTREKDIPNAWFLEAAKCGGISSPACFQQKIPHKQNKSLGASGMVVVGLSDEFWINIQQYGPQTGTLRAYSICLFMHCPLTVLGGGSQRLRASPLHPRPSQVPRPHHLNFHPQALASVLSALSSIISSSSHLSLASSCPSSVYR